MKKIKLLLFLIIALFGFTTSAYAIPHGSSGMSVGECLTFADAFHTITINEGSYYYRYCFQVSCSNGSYIKANKVISYGYRCANGNYDPYNKVTSDGCSRYNGSCTGNKGNPYCTSVTFVDCNKNANGTPYVKPTQAPPTTKATTRATTQGTTRGTTKKTTRNSGGRRTSNPADITIPASTSETTAKPTERRKSNNTNITKITINETEIKQYTNKKSTYTIDIPEDITELAVDVELEDPLSKYTVEGNTGLTSEDSELRIIVTAEDGTTKVVKFKITHSNGKSNDCSLANIYIEEYPIEFNKNEYSYKLTLPKNVTSLDMEVIPTDELNAKYTIENNEKLQHNSVVKVIVIAQDGTECNYDIRISKDSNLWKLLVVIALIVGGLIVAIIFLYRYLKKSKGKYKYE